MSDTKQFANLIQRNVYQQPVITHGKLTSELILKWKLACELYFKMAKIKPHLHVPSVAIGFQHSALNSWYLGSHHRLDQVPFLEFVQELQELFVVTSTHYSSIFWELYSRQQGRPFIHWVNEMLLKNASFEGTSMHISNSRLYYIICKSMDDKLWEHLVDAGLHTWDMETEGIENEIDAISDTALWAWIIAVHRKSGSLQKDDSDSESSQPNWETALQSPVANSPAGQAHQPLVYWRHLPPLTLPPLTKEERTILSNNNGCTRCRRINAGHTAHNCPNGIPSARNYKGIV
jgi:hypothetical protein